MLIKVIKVTKDGQVGYLRSANLRECVGKQAVVESPLEAKNYALPDNALSLEKDLKMLHLKDDDVRKIGSTSVDTADVVEIQVTLHEISSTVARPPHKYPSHG